MVRIEEKLYFSAENNDLYEVKSLLVEKDFFDINWKNPKVVSH